MAVFNPTVRPTQDPNYLGYSRGINVPDTIKPTGQAANEILPKGAQFEGPKYEGLKHADESGLYAGKAAGMAAANKGELIADVAKVADLAAKATDYNFSKNVTEQVYNESSAIRDNFLSNLTKTAQAVKTGQSNATVGGAVSGDTANDALDIVTQQPQQTPEELENLPHQVEGLASSRANNKISPTDFYARLNSMAKSYRARYPGYKELIDQTVSKVTGVNPANAQIKSTIADINAAAAKKGDTKTKDRAWLLSHADQVPNGIDLVQRFDRGEDFYKLASIIQPVLNANAQFDYETKVAAAADREAKQKGIDVGKAITTHSDLVAQQSLESIKLDTGLDTDEKMTDFMTRYSKGQVAVDTIQWPQLDNLVRQNRATTKAQLLKFYNTPIPGGNGETPMTLHGQEETMKKIDKALVYHDAVLESIGQKDPGMANTNLNMSKAAATDTLVSMFGTKDTGAIMKIMAAFTSVSPDFAKTMNDAVMMNKDIPQIDKTALIAQIAKLSTPPKSFVTPRTGTSLGTTSPATQPTIKEEVNKAVDHGMTNTHIKSLMELPQQIFDPNNKDDLAKRALAASAFDPKNAGLIAQFETDKMNRGDFVPGQQSIYKSLVNEKMSAEIWRLSQADPQLWQNYKTFARDELANGPLKMDVRGMNVIQLPPSYRMTWDADNHQIGIRDALGKDVLNSKSPLPSPYVKNTVKRINGGLESLATVAKYDKSTNVDVYLLQTLLDYGYNPREAPLSIPDNVMSAILASRKPKPEGAKK